MSFSSAPVCAGCLEALRPLPDVRACELCGMPFEEAAVLQGTTRCGACLAEMPAFNRARSFGVYEGTLRRLIHLLKYERMQPLAKPLADVMAVTMESLPTPDLLVPVPLFRTRQWRRGFNQALTLSRGIARRTGIPLDKQAVRRRRDTQPQAGLSYAERRRNVAGAFVVSQRGRVAGKVILVIDDVMTTGATLDACARSLKTAGAKSVFALTVARAKRRLLPVDKKRAAGES